jgi:hypothetical protein
MIIKRSYDEVVAEGWLDLQQLDADLITANRVFARPLKKIESRAA